MSKSQVDTSFDFGFSTVHGDDVNPQSATNSLSIANQYKAKFDTLCSMIMPFLSNLKKNPENDLIKWPNREKKINEFIEKINELKEA